MRAANHLTVSPLATPPHSPTARGIVPAKSRRVVIIGPEKRYDGERTANYEGGLGVRIKAECVGMWIVHRSYARNDQQIKTVNNEIFGHSFSQRIAL